MEIFNFGHAYHRDKNLVVAAQRFNAGSSLWKRVGMLNLLTFGSCLLLLKLNAYGWCAYANNVLDI